MLVPSHLENVSEDDSDGLEITFANEIINTNPMQPCDGRLELFLLSNKNLQYEFTSNTTYRIFNYTKRTMPLGAKIL